MLGPVPGRKVSDETLLLVAESADLATGDRSERLRRLGAALDAELGHITMPTRRSLSLTSRTGEIPITIGNEGGRPAKVLLRLSSDKLEFVGGREKQVDLSRANTTVRFRVKARASGTFPLSVGLFTPDGKTSLTPQPIRFSIRSSSVPGVGIAVSVAAVLVLGLWWLRTLVAAARARRQKVVARRTGDVPVVVVER